MKQTEKKSDGAGGAARLPLLRLGITGIFMGMANLVPGVSGGTMVLALGLYEEFIGAFSDLTRLRVTRRAVIVVALLFGMSGATIFTLAGAIQFLMENYLPAMLALFIGMTLGGVPTLWGEMRPLSRSGMFFAAVGFVLMGVVAFVLEPGGAGAGWLMFLIGGVVGSSAMILPGISGSYMLLVMGLYLPIIAAISLFMESLKQGDFSQAFGIGWSILAPVGLGLVVGLVILTNLLKYMMRRHHRATIGFLMGLLLGSVLGLYPFKGPAFHKLGRYSVEADGGRELRVLGYGWRADGDSPVYRGLQRTEREGMRLRVLDAQAEGAPDMASVARARAEKAILVAYDVAVSSEVRHAVEDKAAGKVELVIVADTSFSVGRLAVCVVLMAGGFFVTFLLGRLGGEGDSGGKGAEAAAKAV